MPQASDHTCFAPAARAPAEAIERQFAILSDHQLPTVFNAIPVIAMVLNDCRQVVFGNSKFTAAISVADIREALGKRPGEAFRCVHAASAPGGCGTGEFCAYCGAVRSIMQGFAGRQNIQECSINREDGDKVEAFDLLVSSSPFSVGDERFVIFTITDVSHEKRRRALERIFFHDMLNTVGGLQGLMEFLAEEVHEGLREDARFIHSAMAQLTDEIISQKQLLAAESNELKPKFTSFSTGKILEQIETTFQNSEQAKGKRIALRNACQAATLRSDQALLQRVLGNMVKNALEATDSGGTVTLSCDRDGDSLRFCVHNDAVIPKHVRMRIFNRSFSTKGAGRGLGAYSIKLLTERYLGGTADFLSTPETGTVFRVRLPLDPEAAAPPDTAEPGA